MTARQYCTFELGGRLYGVGIEHVQEVLREQDMTVVPLAPSFVRGLINLRGEIVPALDLRARLGLPASAGASSNMVLRTDSGLVSLLVDAIGDVLEVREADVEPTPPSLSGPARRLLLGVVQLERRLLHVLDHRAIHQRPEPDHG